MGEVYGREWSFGMTFDDTSTGITSGTPGQNRDHTFRETLSMGYTSLSAAAVISLVNSTKIEWKGCTYNVLSRNCHCFSNELCRRLGVKELPGWVNDLADTGAQTVEFLDKGDSGYDGGAALFDFIGSFKQGIYNAFVTDDASSAAKKHPLGLRLSDGSAE